ncbi:tumor necrosis factor receptor superfamily member 16-like [Branchiostoma floridae]|uniref:Tumor necrosis factor receptor superfamily member 16-like n=1 Tax=Branchiostoma floridae TaxID=7739 RepID=A0A9J7MLN3_BRAFL|nr:tumor necrosis factor receptor superfamily member 16-like [Branchiostoma floridae]
MVMSDICVLLSAMSQENVTDKKSYWVVLGLFYFMICTRAASVDDCPENKYYMEPWCISCTVCQDQNREVLQPCLPQSDAVCGDCFPGYYLDQRYCHSCVYAPADHRYCQLWLASQTTARPAASTTMSTSTQTQTQHTIIQTTPPPSTKQESTKPTNNIISMSTSSNPSKVQLGPTLGPGPVAAIVASVVVLTLIGTLVWRFKQRVKYNKEEATPVQATDEDQQVHSYP